MHLYIEIVVASHKKYVLPLPSHVAVPRGDSHTVGSEALSILHFHSLKVRSYVYRASELMHSIIPKDRRRISESFL